MIKKYKKYIDSGLDWVGHIPEEWRQTQLKYISSITKGKKAKEDYQNYQKGMIPYLSMEYLRSQTESPSYVNSNDPNIVLVDKQDLLILWDGSKAGEIVKAKNGALSSTMGKIHLESESIDPNFLTFYLKNAEQYIQANTVGMGIPHVSGEVLRTLLISLPSQLEQKQIVQYLDHQTLIIDHLVQQKEKLIELLKEEKQAVINEVVTKGLNPNAKMKYSGIEWLGEVPEHWPIIKLKHVVDMKSGNFISAEMIEDEGLYPVFGGNGIRGYHNEFTYEGFYPLIGRQGALCGNINYANGKFWPTEHAVVVTPKKQINSYWMGEFLRLMNLNQYSQASAQPGLSVEKIINLRISLPTIIEQNEIASKVESLVKNHDLANKNLIESIKKLKEYRQSIISEAVTGKIDVRDWHPNKKHIA